jgi:hypothetical protein
VKNFDGYCIYSTSSCCERLNGRIVERTIRKAFPDDDESTLYIVKVKGVKAYQQLYENEMYK